MKKILFAAAALAFATNAFASVGTASSPTAYTHTSTNTSTAGVGQPEVFTYTATANRAGYVKNNFDFTMSAWSIGKALEPTTGGTQLSVGVVSARGRGLYTGNSDGGSVSQCGALVSSADAKTVSNLVGLLARTSVAATASSGCLVTP